MRRTITATYSNKPSNEMKGNTATKQYLIDNGFKAVGSCNCGGMFTQKLEYQTMDGVIRVQVRGSNYLLKRPNETAFAKHPISTIKQMVDEVKRDYEKLVAAPQAKS